MMKGEVAFVHYMKLTELAHLVENKYDGHFQR